MTWLLDGILKQSPAHWQNRLVAVPDRTVPGTEDNRISRRDERHIIVTNNRNFLHRHRIRCLALILHPDTLGISRNCLGIYEGSMCRARHLLQSIEHRIICTLQESVSVIDRLFILSSMPLQHSPAYLFTTNSTLVPSDGGDSWIDYIP